ncbi:MAG: sensor of ECF-type sigma factor [Bacteroidota bacterium]|jgi:hypothetical protein
MWYKYKIWWVIILTGFYSVAALSQNNDKKEKIESFKVAFITQKLNLTTKEAQQFWPVYNEYLDKIEVLKNSRKKELRSASINIESYSDKDLELMLDNEFLSKEKEVELGKEYFNKFKSVIPVKKVILLYKAEDEFKRELLRQISGK